MAAPIVIAGATGELGGRIATELRARDAEVVAIVRPGTSSEKIDKLKKQEIKTVEADMADTAQLKQACQGAACVISTLAGLQDVIINTQTVLLNAAVAAGVSRFIPSDFAADFTRLAFGENRNFDLRRTFHESLDRAAIKATSILNGAFAELLTSRMPLIDFESKRVNYWGDADQRLDFTTMDNVAEFTAAVALDPFAPRILKIAGDQISARYLAVVAGEVTKSKFELVRLGSVEELAAMIKEERAAKPESENQMYPKWQALQYMHNMFSGRAKLEPLDNARYPDMKWTTAREVIAAR